MQFFEYVYWCQVMLMHFSLKLCLQDLAAGSSSEDTETLLAPQQPHQVHIIKLLHVTKWHFIICRAIPLSSLMYPALAIYKLHLNTDYREL